MPDKGHKPYGWIIGFFAFAEAPLGVIPAQRMGKMSRIKLVVLFGGQSSEHEVSRVSAQSVLENLNRDKYEISMIGITKQGKWLPYKGDLQHIGSGQWEQEATAQGWQQSSAGNGSTLAAFLHELAGMDKIDVIFPVLHGTNGEDGTIQGLFEMAEIPYVGCNVLSSAAGMDKAVSKALFEHAGIPQGKYIVIRRPEISNHFADIEQRVRTELGYPCFVKPANAGSSVGISKVKGPDQLLKAVNFAGQYDRKILIEEFIDGREVECAVLGYDTPQASTVGEIVPCNEFYDYNAKYLDGDSKIIIPAILEEETVQTIRLYAVAAFQALDCSGLSRIDFFVEKQTGKVYINEINTLPGFTSISMYPKLWEASGFPYEMLLDRLIELAMERFHENRKTYEREI